MSNSERWACGSSDCDRIHNTKESAIQCANGRLQNCFAYLCSKCEQEHITQSEAMDCCSPEMIREKIEILRDCMFKEGEWSPEEIADLLRKPMNSVLEAMNICLPIKPFMAIKCVEKWRCGLPGCVASHETRSNASQCASARVRSYIVYLCKKCGQEHDTKSEANNCCSPTSLQSEIDLLENAMASLDPQTTQYTKLLIRSHVFKKRLANAIQIMETVATPSTAEQKRRPRRYKFKQP